MLNSKHSYVYWTESSLAHVCNKGIVLWFLEPPSEPVIGIFLTSLHYLKAYFLFSAVTLREMEKKSSRIRLIVNHWLLRESDLLQGSAVEKTTVVLFYYLCFQDNTLWILMLWGNNEQEVGCRFTIAKNRMWLSAVISIFYRIIRSNL